MKTKQIPPFLFLMDDSPFVDLGPWMLGPEELGTRVEEWDPDFDLVLEREGFISPDELRRTVGLSDDAGLDLVARWSSDATRIGGVSSLPLSGHPAGLEIPVKIRVKVPGHRAGGNLDVETLIILASPGRSSQPAAARRAGSILWHDRVRTTLEGSAAQFPVSSVPFSDLGHLPSGAWWHIAFASSEMDTPFMRAVRVLINSDVPGLTTALASGSQLPQSAAVTSMLVLDVTRSLIALGMESGAFINDPGFIPESLGAAVHESVSAVWPGAPLISLAERWASDRPGMETDIQACLALGVGE